jgi:hypothetical protein
MLSCARGYPFPCQGSLHGCIAFCEPDGLVAATLSWSCQYQLCCVAALSAFGSGLNDDQHSSAGAVYDGAGLGVSDRV